MDIDLELDYSDRISDFLRSKLKEIKAENARLESSLKYRQEIVSKLRTEISENNSSLNLQITDIWKRIANGKYIIGIEVKNENETPIDNLTVTLEWTSSTPLNYKFYILSTPFNSLVDGLNFTPILSKFCQIIITLDVPLFSEQLFYTISGFLSFQRNANKISINFPINPKLLPEDVTDNSFIVQLYKVVEGNVRDILALAISGEKHEYVIVGEHFETLLESVLTKVDVNGKKRYYVSYRISPVIDGVLLEFDNNDGDQNFAINIFCRDSLVATAFFHFLQKNIVGVSFIPKSLYQVQYPSNQMSELLKNSILNELTQLEISSKEDLMELRSKMTDLERQTDTLISQLNEKQSG